MDKQTETIDLDPKVSPSRSLCAHCGPLGCATGILPPDYLPPEQRPQFSLLRSEEAEAIPEKEIIQEGHNCFAKRLKDKDT